MMTVKIAYVTSVAFLLLGCGNQKSGNAALEKVQQYCAELGPELQTAADKYREFAGIADPEQKNRTGLTLPYGATWSQRGRVSVEIRKRLGLCTAIRRNALVDDKTSAAFVALAETEDPARVAESLAEISAFADKIAALPLVD